MPTTIPYKASVLFDKLRERGYGPVCPAGDEFRCRCPAHADSSPSLYIGIGGGTLLLNCKAGCTGSAICDALDLAQADLFFTAEEPWVEPGGDVAATHDNGTGTPPPPGVAGPEPTAPDIRHDVYTVVLAALELSTAHFDALRGRGLTPADIARGQYRTADAVKVRPAVDKLLTEFGRDRLLTVPGFRERDGRITLALPAGMVIPVRRPGGNVAALKVRSDQPGRPKYTWVSSPEVSCGNPVHVPLGVTAPCPVARVTEGELKADVAHALSGVPTISAPGVTNWPLLVPVLTDLGTVRVLLAMDRDGKRPTLEATEKALLGLTRAGFDVELETWDAAAGKGIDDLLAAGDRPAVVTGLAAAVRLRDELTGPTAGAREPEPEPEPAPFPVDVFPPAVAEYCCEVARATSTPPDFAGVAILVAAAAAIGNARTLELKANAWYESPRFYAAGVGDPAAGKTPATDTVVAPCQHGQQALIAGYKTAKAAHDHAVEVYERAAKAARSAPGGVPPPPPPPEPAPPERLLVMDVTVEGLAPILEQAPRGLFMVQDELAGWVGGMNQYKGGKGNDRQFWLSTWSGKSHLVDRKAQGVIPVSIPRPFVCVLGGIQPDMLGELTDRQGRSDGFLHRILFVYPTPTGTAGWTDDTVSDGAAAAWADCLARLRALEMVATADGTPGPDVVRFSPAGKDAWVAWYDAHAAEMRDPDLPARLLGPWGKLKSYAARIILVLHHLWGTEADRAGAEVEADTVARAVRLVDYFKAHTRRVYARLNQAPDDARLEATLDWVRDHGNQCTARDLLKAKKVADADAAKKLIRELEERGYGRCESRDAVNGKKVTWFVFDPA